MTNFTEINASGFQMVSGFSLVNRSSNTTEQHIGSSIDDKTAISECIDAIDSISVTRAGNVDIFKANAYVSEVFRKGYREELLQLPDTFKFYMMENFEEPDRIDLGFGLLRLKPDVLPIRFKYMQQDPFEKFKLQISGRFSEHFNDLGSDDFLERLHSYFDTHGNSRGWYPVRETYGTYEGRSDENMTYTALVLKDEYGEKKVMDFLDRLITEMPANDAPADQVIGADDPYAVKAVDALRIIQSDVDFSEMPLYWAIHLAAEV